MSEKLHFTIHTPRIFEELLTCVPQVQTTLRIPLLVFRSYIDMVATRASQLNDPILNELMCDMTLYAIADPYDKENHNREAVKKVKEAALQQREKEDGKE